MEIVTGYVGRPHVTAEQDRAQNQGVFGVESYVLNVGQKMAAELQSNNEIRIRDGVLVHQGCTGVVKTGTYDPVTITNGTQGMKRIDLIVARYTKNAETNVENLAWKVIQGTPAASNPAIPSYIEGDIQAGDLISDMPMYEIHLDGITVSEVKAVFTALKTGAEMQADISSLNSNLAGKQDSLIAGQFVEGFAGDGTLLMTWSKIGVSKKPSAVIITPCSSQDVIVSYNYDYNTAGTIQLRAYSTASGAAFSGALRFSMLVIQ